MSTLKNKTPLKKLAAEELNKVCGGTDSNASDPSGGPWIEIPVTDPAKKGKKIIPVTS